MKNHKKKAKTAYYDSLPRIFIWAGFDVFISLLIICVGVGLIAFLYNRLDTDGIKLMLWCFLMMVLFSYAPPMMSLLKVWRQEHILGVYWKDRTDQDQPVQERDWYLAYNRGGFLLCHRAYIQHILGEKVITESTDLGHQDVYCLRFEDICGKKHTVKFSSAGERKQFQQWYKKQAYTNKSDEVE